MTSSHRRAAALLPELSANDCNWPIGDQLLSATNLTSGHSRESEGCVVLTYDAWHLIADIKGELFQGLRIRPRQHAGPRSYLR